MNSDQFESLVGRLEKEQAEDPRRYRRKVVLLAAAGYAYIAVVLVAAIALLLGSLAVTKSNAIAAKFIWVVGLFVFLVVRALWVRLQAPEGREISRREAPALFAMLDQLRRLLKVDARFHHVLLTDEFNAAVVQVPRLGILGWHRNYLIIGLPLMKALTRKQLAAVLAHEFGHLTGGHGRLGNWIYRLRLGWIRLSEMLEQTESIAGIVFRPFFTRYVPYFSAVSFPLARADEYEADRNAAHLTSATAAAAALTTVEVMNEFLHSRFWPEMHQRAITASKPHYSPFREMDRALRAVVDDGALRGWLAAAMARRTSVADTHPALCDRLAALGQAPRLALPVAGEAADTLLGASLAPLNDEFDRRWQAQVAPAWERRYENAQEERAELSELDARAAEGRLSTDERFRRALLTEEVGTGRDAALKQLRQLLDECPDHIPTIFALGARLLELDDEGGVALIERAISLDATASGDGAALLRDFHARRGRSDESTRWHKTWMGYQETAWLAEQERSRVNSTDQFQTADLSPEQLQAVRASLLLDSRIKAAWIVRKRVQQFPEHRHYVIGFTTTPWYRMLSVKRANAVRDAILGAVSVPGSLIVVCVEASNSGIERRLDAVPGSRLLGRQRLFRWPVAKRRETSRAAPGGTWRPIALMGVLLALLVAYFGLDLGNRFRFGGPVEVKMPPLAGTNRITGLKVHRDEKGRWIATFDYFYTGDPAHAQLRVGALRSSDDVSGGGDLPGQSYTYLPTQRGAQSASAELFRPNTSGASTTRHVVVQMTAQGKTLLSERLSHTIDWPDFQTWAIEQELAQKSVDQILERAIALIDLGDADALADARTLLQRILKDNPQYDPAYVEMARVVMKTNWGSEGLRQAEGLLNSALQMRPDSVNAKILLGYVHAHQRRFKSADSLFRDASQTETKNLWLWANWGELEAMQGRNDAAAQKYSEALKRPRTHDTYDRARLEVYSRLIEMYERKRDLDSAEALFRQQATEFGSGNCYVSRYARFMLQKRGDTAAAITLARQVLDQRCSDVASREVLGMAYYVAWAEDTGADRLQLLHQARVYFPSGPKLLYLLSTEDRTAGAAKQLVAGGESIDQLDNAQLNALAYALQLKDYGTARRLLRLGARPDALVGDGVPVALLPVLVGDSDGVRALQQAGVDFSRLQYRGMEPREIAKKMGDRKVMEALDPKARSV